MSRQLGQVAPLQDLGPLLLGMSELKTASEQDACTHVNAISRNKPITVYLTLLGGKQTRPQGEHQRALQKETPTLVEVPIKSIQGCKCMNHRGPWRLTLTADTEAVLPQLTVCCAKLSKACRNVASSYPSS